MIVTCDEFPSEILIHSPPIFGPVSKSLSMVAERDVNELLRTEVGCGWAEVVVGLASVGGGLAAVGGGWWSLVNGLFATGGWVGLFLL